MSFKTIVIIVLAVLITVIFMQNTDEVLFTLLWKELYISKLLMMLIVTVFGFVIGVIVARPRKKIITASNTYHNDDEISNNSNSTLEDEDYISMKKPKTLSDEDRDYIS